VIAFVDLGQLDLSKIVPSDQLPVVKEIQSFLDWCMVDNADIGHALFKQLRKDAPTSIRHFREILELVPPNMSFQQMIRIVPKVVLLENKAAFDLGEYLVILDGFCTSGLLVCRVGVYWFCISLTE